MGCGSLFIAEFQIVSKCADIFIQIKRGKSELIWQISDLMLPILFFTLSLGFLAIAVKTKGKGGGKQIFEVYFWVIGLFLGTGILTFLYGQLGWLVYTT